MIYKRIKEVKKLLEKRLFLVDSIIRLVPKVITLIIIQSYFRKLVLRIYSLY